MDCTVSMREVGNWHNEEGDHQAAFEYFSRAAELNDADGHMMLGNFYYDGNGVERNLSKAVSHFETSAIAGHPRARNNLGVIEWEGGRYERAIKHWIIAAKAGHDGSVEYLKQSFKCGFFSIKDFAAVLRAHQAAVDATKSPQRQNVL